MMVGLNDSSIPEWYMVAVGHLTADGKEAFQYTIKGEYSVASVNLVLDSIKHRLLASTE